MTKKTNDSEKDLHKRVPDPERLKIEGDPGEALDRLLGVDRNEPEGDGDDRSELEPIARTGSPYARRHPLVSRQSYWSTLKQAGAYTNFATGPRADSMPRMALSICS